MTITTYEADLNARLASMGYVSPGARILSFLRGTGSVLRSVYRGADKTVRYIAPKAKQAINYAAPRIQKAWVESAPQRAEALQEAREIAGELGKATRDAYVYVKPRAIALAKKTYANVQAKSKAYAETRTNEKAKSTAIKQMIYGMVRDGVLGYTTRSSALAFREGSENGRKNHLMLFDKPIEYFLPGKNAIPLFSRNLPRTLEAKLVPKPAVVTKPVLEPLPVLPTYEQKLQEIQTASENSSDWNAVKDLAYRIYEETKETNEAKNWQTAQERLARSYENFYSAIKR